MIPVRTYTGRDVQRGVVGIGFGLAMGALATLLATDGDSILVATFLAAIALWSVVDGAKALVEKRLEIDADGVRLISGGRARFDLAWTAIDAIYLVEPRSSYGRQEEIAIHADTYYTITLRDLPKATLTEVKRELRRIVAEHFPEIETGVIESYMVLISEGKRDHAASPR